MRCILGFFIVGLAALPAAASITVDGTLDGAYGPALAVQAVQTQFGDASPPGNLGGSELDAGYAKIWNGRLYIMLTGNQEPNFNKLDIFIDSKAGGENMLSGTPQYDFSPSAGFWISQNFGGLTFDTGFEADYHLLSRWGGGPGPYEVDFVDRAGGGSAMVPGASAPGSAPAGLVSTGSIPAGDIGPNASGSSLTQSLEFAINDNNAAGVSGGAEAANVAAALAVTTGMEFSIALADLGNPSVGSVINIAAMINNGDHNFLSNQILGPLLPNPANVPPSQGNLGGNGSGGFTGTLSGVNFNQFAGLQYFSVVVVPEIPEPATAVMLGGLALVGLAACGRRRK